MKTDIWIDIDDTIANTSDIIMKEAIDYHKTALKKQVVLSNVKSKDYYYFARRLGWNRDELCGFFDTRYPQYLEKLEIKQGVVETINRLREKGMMIRFISSRRESSQKKDVYTITAEWLKKKEIKYDDLIIDCYDKYEVLSSETGIYIDDSCENCNAVCTLGTFDVYQMESPYGEVCMDTRIKVVKNWIEINQYLT